MEIKLISKNIKAKKNVFIIPKKIKNANNPEQNIAFCNSQSHLHCQVGNRIEISST